MGNMNKSFVCFFFVLLGVAASFADEGLLRRFARSASPFPQGPYAPNNPGAYPFPGGFDFQQPFGQYFNNFQAQQEAFQAQIRQQQQSGHYSWATSMSYITNPLGESDPNARVYAYSEISPDGAIASSNIDSKLGYGISKSSVSGNSIFEMNNRLGNGSPYGGGPSYGGPQSASASISIGPQGGFQTGQISPAAPGIFSRFAESVQAPSGNSFGVFSSSSSQSAVGPDGKQTSFKSATTGVNDNGRVTYQTVHDP